MGLLTCWLGTLSDCWAQAECAPCARQQPTLNKVKCNAANFLLIPHARRLDGDLMRYRAVRLEPSNMLWIYISLHSMVNSSKTNKKASLKSYLEPVHMCSQYQLFTFLLDFTREFHLFSKFWQLSSPLALVVGCLGLCNPIDTFAQARAHDTRRWGRRKRKSARFFAVASFTVRINMNLNVLLYARRSRIKQNKKFIV